MADIGLLQEALAQTFTLENIIIIIIVSMIGIILGALPGVGATLALALAFPFTFTMDPTTGLTIMAVLYGSTVYGGSISAIIINVPGTGSNAATLLDGYPMSRKGEGNKALGLSALGSLIGSIIGLIILFLFAPRIAELSLLFGPPEFFLLAVFGLAVVATVVTGSIWKNFTSISFGVFLATIGSDPITATPRFDFGTTYLQGGINLIVLIIGIFAVSQGLDLIITALKISRENEISGSALDGLKELVNNNKINALRSSLIGAFIGSIPGVGSAPANFISYLVCIKRSKVPETFGQGNPKGVVAAEAANNAGAMGAFVPALAFAIPGSAATAVFIGAMISFGIVPGASVFDDVLPYIIMSSMLIGVFVYFSVGVTLSRYFAVITILPYDIVAAGILTFSFVGAFAVRNNLSDLLVALTFGVLGLVMIRRGYSLVGLIIGFILAPIAEGGYRRAMLISSNDPTIFISDSISIILVILTFVIVLSPVINTIRK